MDTKLIISGILAAIAVIPVTIMLGEKDTGFTRNSEQVAPVSPSSSATNMEIESTSRDPSNGKSSTQEESSTAVTELVVTNDSVVDAIVTSSANLIDTFTLVAPTDSANCATRDPWGQGIKTLEDQDKLSASDCFALRVSVLEDVEVYMFSHSENGTLVRLFSSSCNALGPVNSRVHSGEEIQLPQDNGGNHLVIGLDEQSGTEWFYAIAIKTEQAKQAKQALNNIVSAIPDVCQEENTHVVPVKDFKSDLDKLQKHSGAALQWQARSFLHI